MPVIRYSVTRDGQIVLDFDGFRGKVCINEFDKLVELLKQDGIEVQDLRQEKKQEYYQVESYEVQG